MPTLAELQAISKAVEDQAAEAEARAANVSVGGHTWRALAEGVGQIGSAATGLLPEAVPGAKAAHDWLNQSVQESQVSRGASALPILSQRGFVPALAGVVPSVAATVGATALKRSPWTAPIVAAGLAAHPAYEQGQQAAIEEGRPDEAVGRGLQNALASGAAELVIGRAFPGFEQAVASRLRNETIQRAGQTATEAGKGAWRTAMRAAAPALSEGAEEALVQAAQGTSAKLLGADASSWSDIGRQSLEAGALGLTLGGGTHGLVAGADMAARAAGLRAPPTVVPEVAMPGGRDLAGNIVTPPVTSPPPAVPSVVPPVPEPPPTPVPPAHAVRFSPEYQAAVAPHLVRMRLQQVAPEGLDPNLAQGFEVRGPQGPVAAVMPATREEIAATATDPSTPANAEALMRSYFEGKGNPKGFAQWQKGFQAPAGSSSHRRAMTVLQNVATRSAAGQTNIGQPADVPNAQAGMTARIVAGSEEGGMKPPATGDQVTATLHEMFHVAWGRLTPVEHQVLAVQAQRSGASNAEEWAAYAFADYCRAVPPTAAPTSVIERIFAKIRSWFAEIGRAFGFQSRPSFEAVMQLVQGGEVFARPGPTPQTTVSPAEQAIIGHRQQVAQEAATTAKTREEQDRAAEAKRVMAGEELGIQVEARRQSVERAQEAVTDLADRIAALAESPEADPNKIAKLRDKLRKARGKLHLARRKLAHAQGKRGLRPAPDVETPVIKEAPRDQEARQPVRGEEQRGQEPQQAPAQQEAGGKAPEAGRVVQEQRQEVARSTRAENLAASVRAELARPAPRFDRVDRLMQTLADEPGTPAQALTDLRADVHAAKVEAAGRGVRGIRYATRRPRNLANQLYADYQEGLRRGRESKVPERMTRAELQADAIAYIKKNGKATKVAADLTERLRKGEALNPTQQEAFLMLMNRQHLKGMAAKHGQANKIKAIEMSARMAELGTLAGRLLSFRRDEIATPAERLAMWHTMAFTPPASVRKRAFAETDPRKTKEVLAKWYERQKKALGVLGITEPNFATMADDMTAYRMFSALQSLQATGPEIAFTFFLSNLFSGLTTQARNLAGNLALLPIMHVLVTPARAFVNDTMRLSGVKSEGIGVKNLVAFYKAFFAGLPHGIAAALSSVYNGTPYLESLMGLTDVTSERTPVKHRVLAVTGARIGGAVGGRVGARLGQMAGAALEAPLRGIMGVDQLFKFTAANAMAAAVASRMAKGDEAKARALMEDYHSEAWTEALKYARETTLNKPLPPSIARLTGFRQPTSWQGLAGAILFPVIGVPINALRLGLDLVGGGILRHFLARGSEDFKKDEAKDNLSRAVAMLVVGAGIIGVIASLTRARDDKDDGRPVLTPPGASPVTQKGKAAAEATDVGQGGAISFDGKTFFSLADMPGAEFLGAIAAFRDLSRRLSPGETMPEAAVKQFDLLAQQFAAGVSNRTFMRNVADVVRVLTEVAAAPSAEGKKSFYNTRRLLLRTAAGFVPYSALQSQLTQMAGKGESEFVEKDETTYRRRASDTVTERDPPGLFPINPIDIRDLKRLSAPLVFKVEPREPAVDAWGRPLVSIPERFAGSLMGKILATTFRAQEVPGKEDRIAEIDRALHRLAEKHDWAYLPTIPAAEYTLKKNDGSSVTKTMSEEQYREFCQRAGKQAAEIALGIDQRNPDFFKTISPKSIDKVKEIFTWSRQKARREMGLVGRDESSTSPDEVDPK